MRKSLFGAGSAPQRPGALRTRNSNVENTPKNRQSGGSVRKSYLPQVDSGKRGIATGNSRQSVTQKRISAEGLSRISVAGGSRYTPTRSRTTPTRPGTAANNNLQPNTNRLSIESSRSSSIGGRSVRKESRPLNDPKFKSICIDKILEFLKQNGYDSQIIRRNLLTPTTKDFINVFNFIYRHLDCSYQLPAKFEDEIPKLLKKCKYPVQMSKSSFITVGSPHTWPAVLAMLSWIVDVVNIYNSVEPMSQAFPDDFDVDINKEKCKFIAMVKCVQFSEDKDACNSELEKYRHILEEHEQVRPQDMIKIQEEEDRLDQEFRNLTIGPERLQNLEHQYHQIINDKEKLDSYCGDLRAIVSKKDAEVSAFAAELSQLKEESEVICAEIQRLTQFKEEQDLDAAMLVRLKNHAADVKALITQMQSEGKDLDSQIWNYEMELSKVQKLLQESVHSYNLYIQQVELGDGFKVSPVGVAESLHNWETELLNSLRTFKKSAKQNLFQTQTNKQRIEEEKCSVLELLQDKQVNLNKCDMKLKRLEDNIQMTKNEVAQEELEMREECERLHIQVTEANRVHKGSVYQKQCALDKSKEKLSSVKIHGRDRMKNGADFLVKVCKRSLEHAEFISRETVKSKLTIQHMVTDVIRLCTEEQK